MRPAAAALLALAVAAPLRADSYPRQPGIDVVHYVFRLALSDESDAIEGDATIDVRVTATGVRALTLDLVATGGQDPSTGMTVWGVSEGGSALAYEHVGDRLVIRLARPGTAGERRRIDVRYGGVPRDGLMVGPTRHGERSFFSDNWPDKARHWLPSVDHPYDKATADVIVDAPARYQVVANGLLVEESDRPGGQRRSHWRQSVPIATWLYALGAARFAVDHRTPWRGRPIQTWVYPQDRETGFRVFAGPTVAALDFFDDRIGPYSYEKLAQVQSNSVGGGMEAATVIFYGDESASGERPERWRNVIVHEIAHQWFGNAVTESDWDDVWLSEGFATYFTLLFIEHARGRDAFVEGLRSSRERILAFHAENPGYRVVHDRLDDMSRVVTGQTYQLGAWTLHMLRGLIGDEAFWAGIRAYYARHRDGNATTADFRRAVEDASGRELGWFFEQWLYRGGLPELRGGWRHEAAAGALLLELEQIQEGDPYRLPLELAIHHAGEPEASLERIELRERRGVFRFASERPPEALLFDPGTWTVAETDLPRLAASP